jgi:integrase
MVDATDAGIIGVRDRALVLLGFAGAFRRSELVALDLGDCTFGKDGLTVTLRRSKTDQDGAGRRIGIPYGSDLTRVRCGRFRPGWNSRISILGRYFARSIGMGRSSKSVCPASMLLGW